MSSSPEVVECIQFNSTHDMFITTLRKGGIRVFNTHPLVEKGYLDIPGLRMAAMLEQSNLVAVVGGGPNSEYADNAVLIWDDALKKFIVEVTFSSTVLSVRLIRHKMIVVLRSTIHIFSFGSQGMAKVGSVETRDNPRGLCEVSTDPALSMMAFPGRKEGSVQLVDVRGLGGEASQSPLTINAHQSQIAVVAVNVHGTLVATGSVQGTIVRVFDTRSRTQIGEFRRGSDPATLQSLVFSQDSSFIAMSSDKHTIHIFAVRDKTSNKKTILQHVGIVTEEACRSLAQFNIPIPPSPAVKQGHNYNVNHHQKQQQHQSTMALGFIPNSQNSSSGAGKVAASSSQTHHLIAVCCDGTYHKLSFTMDGGQCKRDGYAKFLQLPHDLHFWDVKA